MWRKLCFLLVMAGNSYTELVGDHICAVEETYLVNVTEYFLRNATIRDYKWCINVPPRCSFYTTRQVNESRIIEKNITRLVDKCCPGFIVDEATNSCIPKCTHCIHGICTPDRTCNCFSGYTGETCDQECSPSYWGINCKHECTCGRGTCEPQTGICNCQAGYTGKRCEKTCSFGYYGKNCETTCNCNAHQTCDIITGLCQDLTTVYSIRQQSTTKEIRAVYFANDDRFGNLSLRKIFNPASKRPSLQLYDTFDSITAPSVVDVPFVQSTSSEQPTHISLVPGYSTTEIGIFTPQEKDSESTILKYKNNGKFTITENNLSKMTEADKNQSPPSSIPPNKLTQSDKRPTTEGAVIYTPSVIPNIRTAEIAPYGSVFPSSSPFNDGSKEGTPEFFVAQSNDHDINNHLNFDDTMSGDVYRRRNDMSKETDTASKGAFDLGFPENSNFLNDEAHHAETGHGLYVDQSSLVNSVSISTAMSMCAIVVAIIIVISKYYRNKHKTRVNDGGPKANEKISTVSVVTHSIFHTPLPDPPTIKNPMFDSPLDINDLATFETKVVCSMNFQSVNRDPPEYMYDHPPSTGSYRAASIPEPPDDCGTNSAVSTIHIEPVYDEIPSRGIIADTRSPRAYDSSSTLYINTCGKTRF